NAFRNRTIDELIFCFKRAWADPEVGVVALTGAGDRAFCAGGDQKQRQETGDYGPSESGLMETETLHRTIRDIPKPVIAAVNAVVPLAELRAEVRRWADEMLALSPTALRILKHSFNADSESIAGVGTLAFDTLAIFNESAEAKEGVAAFVEKRKPDFSGYQPKPTTRRPPS